MKKCTDPQIGQMIGRYEFGLLSPEEKEEFEMHCLKCDSCYQELYEFSPVVETIKENISDFQKAVAMKKTVLQRLLEILSPILDLLDRYLRQPILALPKPLQPAIPAVVMAVAIVLIVLVAMPEKQPVSIVDSNITDENISQRQPQRVTLHEPEVMELKGMIETDSSSKDSKTQKINLDNILTASMQVALSEDNKYLVFSWTRIDSIKYYHIDLIDGEAKTRITPKEGIHANNFQYPAKGIEPDKPYVWELSGEMANGIRFKVWKEFVLGQKE